MWATLIAVPAGKPLRFTTNVAVAAVICPAEFVVVSNVTVTLPEPAASAPTTGGTSFVGDSAAVNVGLVGDPVGPVVDEELPHETANSSPTNNRLARFIGHTLPLKELSTQVESEIQTAGIAALRDLRVRHRRAVPELQLEHVSADALFDRERVFR